MAMKKQTGGSKTSGNLYSGNLITGIDKA